MNRLMSHVVSNDPIAEQCYCLTFDYPADLPPPLPGQFLTIRVTETSSPLLRRPFAFSGHDPVAHQASIIYERRGPATRLMTAFRPGDPLDVIGPIGNAFPLPGPGTSTILVGGGIGMGPVLFQHARLLAAGCQVRLAIGGRSRQRLPVDHLPAGTILSTDDGSLGYHGTIVQALEAVKPAGGVYSPAVQLCGPGIMMHAAGLWAKRSFLSPVIHVSMEQTMACAVGACMGCVIKVHHDKTYARVCAEGPVFDFNFIEWD